ncbi:MAG: hypothetical protein P4M11_16075 [Candidatus Pacebacteria bacterium]|nr:hypothetical protein [Candidatus Paceibacterota bacterium]
MSRWTSSTDAFLATVAEITASFLKRADSCACTRIFICDHKSVEKASKFTSTSVPSISLYDYLKRIADLTLFSEELMVSALVYVDRIIAKRNLKLSSYEVHRWAWC